MKLSKEDIIKKVNEKVMDEDVKIELLEDITDSFEMEEVVSEDDGKVTELEQRVTELEEKNKSLTEKYIERFVKGSEKKETENEDIEELHEEEVIDIKEI